MVKGQYLMLSFLILNNIMVIQGGSSGMAYKLAMQWPASFCSTLSTKDTCIESPPNQWTIHGLWPKNLYCQNSFNIGEISESARVQLAKLWPNLNASSNNEQFWEREWKKHGSCSSLTIEQYFEKVIQLATLYNIYNILEKNSIKPSSKIYYTDKDISESIQKVIGYRPKVHSTKKEPFLVSEIRFCFDQAFRMMDCNTTYQLNPLLYLEHWNKHDEHKESSKAGGSVFVILLVGIVIPVTMICLTIVYFKVFYKHERTSSSDGIYMQVK
uniref:Ribonuclease-like storage protein n=1 Tax=Crassostrea virginica TaxID=6565 RepID=A0A8B8AG72_CRAVI|nr:ribonuclease-like storage protein [Crassostrea virginica]